MMMDTAVLSVGAVALSTSAILVELVSHLRRIGALSEIGQRELYERALLSLEEGQMDDDSGVFRAARELIETHLRPKV